MHIEHLRILNWMPFKGEHSLNLPASPLGVVARYADNPRRSNWAGKTALLEAIRWCLYGVHRKRLEDGIIHRAANECAVEVRLSGGLCVERRRARGGPTKLRLTAIHSGPVEYFEGEAAQTKLEQYLGMNYEDSVVTTTFAQGDTEALVGKTSGDRRRVVAQWLGLDLWERAGAAARVRSAETAAAHTALLNTPEEPRGRPRGEVETELEEVYSQHGILQSELSALHKQLHEWEQANVGEGLEAELEDVTAEGKRAKEEVASLPKVTPEELRSAEAAETAAAQALGQADREVREARSHADKGFMGTCPVMRQACPVAETVRCAGDAAEARLANSNLAYTQAQARHLEAKRTLAELRNRERQVQVAATQYNTAVANYKRLKVKVDERRNRLALLSSMDMATLDSRRTQVLTDMANLEAQTNLLKRELVELEAREKRQAQRAQALEKAARTSRVAAMVKRALGPMGIPARIAADSLGALEEVGNALLAGSGLSFTLGWEREIKEWAPTCLECGHTYKGQREKVCPVCKTTRTKKKAEELEILVEDGSGEVEDVRAKSGGARALVASAIRLAGGMLLRELRGSQVAWAEVDEPFGSLDAPNREELSRCFTAMLGSVGLEQAFIVSHHEGLLEALPARILITREEGYSRLTLEA